MTPVLIENPSRDLRDGHRLKINHDSGGFLIEVLALRGRRGPASARKAGIRPTTTCIDYFLK